MKLCPVSGLRIGSKLNIVAILLLPVIPYILLLNQNKNVSGNNINHLALAGRKVFENSGCNGCHTRFVKMMPEEIVRYFPGNYYKVDLNVFKQRFFKERLDLSGPRVGPDLENTPFHLYGDLYIKEYIQEPRKFYTKSIMPAYGYLFNQKLRNDEIIFASGSLKNKPGYMIYNRGEALLHYLKISSGNFGGNS